MYTLVIYQNGEVAEVIEYPTARDAYNAARFYMNAGYRAEVC